MAGDWIKMRMDLPEDPAVYRLASITKLDRLSIVGRLYAFWSWADKHAVDGRVDGASSQVIDDIARFDGFADAMAAVKWLVLGDDFIQIPNHDRHNGESAKERGLKNGRQARWRQGKSKNLVDDQPSTHASTEPSTTPSTREEKRREENKSSPVVPAGDKLVDAVLSAYHEILPRCERMEAITPKRVRRIKTADRLARSICVQQGWDYAPADFWGAYFDACAADPWLRGDVPNPKNARWKQNLDVLLAEDRFASVMDRAIASMQQGGSA